MPCRALLLAALLALPDVAAAQQQPADAPPPVPGIVRHGKWAAAALFVAATTIAVLENRGADDDFDDLRTMCGTAVPCSIGQDGRYTDPLAEAQYREIVAGDRAARAWFIAGQVALAGAAALFVIELRHTRGSTNIPYSGLIVKPARSGTQLGWRIPLRLP
jgi:hypothetical protein